MNHTQRPQRKSPQSFTSFETGLCGRVMAAGKASAGALPLHRLSASITSWFRLPEQVSKLTYACMHARRGRPPCRLSLETKTNGHDDKPPPQGMERYEMLCRGTAFCVRRPAPAPQSQSTSKPASSPPPSALAFFTCSHVAAPWRWPRLYPLPWLEHVREEHTRCVLHVAEVR